MKISRETPTLLTIRRPDGTEYHVGLSSPRTRHRCPDTFEIVAENGSWDGETYPEEGEAT
jgi:hypothetical protein